MLPLPPISPEPTEWFKMFSGWSFYSVPTTDAWYHIWHWHRTTLDQHNISRAFIDAGRGMLATVLLRQDIAARRGTKASMGLLAWAAVTLMEEVVEPRVALFTQKNGGERLARRQVVYCIAIDSIDWATPPPWSPVGADETFFSQLDQSRTLFLFFSFFYVGTQKTNTPVIWGDGQCRTSTSTMACRCNPKPWRHDRIPSCHGNIFLILIGQIDYKHNRPYKSIGV